MDESYDTNESCVAETLDVGFDAVGWVTACGSEKMNESSSNASMADLIVALQM